MSKYNALISIITRDTIHGLTVLWASRSQQPLDVVITPYTVEHQRNLQAERFLESKLPYLFILDNDVVPQEGTIESLLKHMDGQTIAVAPPFVRLPETNEIFPMAYRRRSNGAYSPISAQPSGVVKVDGSGMSGALIPRSVFSEIPRPWFHTEHDKNGKFLRTEDLYFWEKAKEAGYGIVADLNLTAEHLKLVPLGRLYADL